ncbi:5-methylthioribose kinase [Flavobacterium sp. CG_23.5]|uniref:phosphotransferase n=1 Tax=Flavobacterium sp. CG_23.5 TaxID=2760708 RepID=UPI001AE8B4BC|nr:phosphotransferase [Flavobacterium sp. CG_23.5]MBP2284738.1 5-methylthioribose kinase [Flavobacterium sp. CG_23.5]
MFILNASEPKELAQYLKENQWLADAESILSLTKPGEGNMNYVLRVTTNLRTFIIKQSRAYVEKYPQVPAPAERVITEAGFYQKIASVNAVQSRMPHLLGLDTVSNILLLEDLGKSNDYSVLYDLKQRLTAEEITVLVSYLNELHTRFQKTKMDDELANLELRKLNYEHIFRYPFLEENGFDLNSVQMGLQELALPYKKNAALKSKVELLGSLYLSKGKYLLHGDYYPGSWLKTDDGIKIIDPEFCYFGSREFDLGVLIAHLYLSQQDLHLITVIEKEYAAFADLNPEILNGFVGVEIMRRLIGLAQLPLQMELNEKGKLLELANQLIMK